MSTLREKIEGYFESQYDEDEKIELWNEYCSSNNVEGQIYGLSEYDVDNILDGYSPWDVFRAMRNVNPNEDLFYEYEGAFESCYAFDDVQSVKDNFYEFIDWFYESYIQDCHVDDILLEYFLYDINQRVADIFFADYDVKSIDIDSEEDEIRELFIEWLLDNVDLVTNTLCKSIDKIERDYLNARQYLRFYEKFNPKEVCEETTECFE